MKGDFNYKRGLGDSIKVMDAQGYFVATFSYCAEGGVAWEAFKNGLSHIGVSTLYDIDNERFDVGKVDQLAGI